MLLVFYCHGILHNEFTPKVQTVNVAFYVDVLKRMRDRARRVRSELWEGRNFGDVTTIKSEMTSLLKRSSEADFQGCLK